MHDQYFENEPDLEILAEQLKVYEGYLKENLEEEPNDSIKNQIGHVEAIRLFLSDVFEV